VREKSKSEVEERNCSRSCLLFVSCLFLVLGLAGCGRQPVERVEWVTMGTVAALQVRGDAEDCRGLLGKCQYVCKLITSRFDAHDPASMICRLAALSDGEVLSRSDAVSRPCLSAALSLMRESAGAFNPRWRGTNTLDCGAIAKGYALDVIGRDFRGLFRKDSLLDLGGNLKSVRGTWQVGIAESDIVLTLTNGMACATSAEYYRGKHIYDGRTGMAVSNDVKSVTVVHPDSAMLADGLSTTLFVLGREEGEKFLNRHYPEARAYWIMRSSGR